MGKTWIITGASTGGIGEGIARAVLAKGDNAVITARSLSKLEEIEEGDSEMFPYTTIEKLKKEFIETVRDQNEPMEYGGNWY